MRIDILTIFPKMFDSVFSESIVKRAKEKGLAEINIHDLRFWTNDNHKTVDAPPYGGGAGMVMMIEPIYKALGEIDPNWTAHRVLLTAKGERIVQGKVRELSQVDNMLLICGHYEGVDARVGENFVDEQLSIGDYVLTGGEIPAMVITDAVTRLIPGVVGNEKSVMDESFSSPEAKDKKEYPQYTRPAVFQTKDGEKLKVPDVLLSGDHEKVRKWREERRE